MAKPIAVVDVNALARNWWALLLRGVAAVLFGALTFAAPAISLVALITVFGVYSLVDGVFAVVSAVRQREGRDSWWMLLLEGLVGIGAGVVTLIYPGLTAVALLYLIAAWALITGVLEIVMAVRLRKVITGEWLLALGGVASIAFGIVLILFPGPGALALVLWTGSYAILFGGLVIGLSLRLRSWGSGHDRPQGMTPPHGAEGVAPV